MMKLKKARIIRVGNSHYINIPKKFIDNEIIDVSKRFDVQLVEV